MQKDVKPKTERKKIVTNHEDHNLLVRNYLDISDNVNFFGQLPRSELTRVKINKSIKLS